MLLQKRATVANFFDSGGAASEIETHLLRTWRVRELEGANRLYTEGIGFVCYTCIVKMPKTFLFTSESVNEGHPVSIEFERSARLHALYSTELRYERQSAKELFHLRQDWVCRTSWPMQCLTLCWMHAWRRTPTGQFRHRIFVSIKQ